MKVHVEFWQNVFANSAFITPKITNLPLRLMGVKTKKEQNQNTRYIFVLRSFFNVVGHSIAMTLPYIFSQCNLASVPND